MKNRFLIRVLALTLVISLCADMPVMVIAAETGSVEGTGKIEEVVLQVEVPTSLAFSIDPYQLEAVDTGQVFTPENFIVINRTLAPVMVTFMLEAATNETGDDAVTFVASPGDVFPDDVTKTSKDIYFAVIAANSVASGGVTFATGGDVAIDLEAKYDSTKTDTIVPFATNGTVSFSFAMGKAGEDAYDSGSECYSAFKLYADLNTYADWNFGDIKISGSIKTTLLKPSVYEEYRNGFSEDAHQLVKDRVKGIEELDEAP